jgi:hypothetical protein
MKKSIIQKSINESKQITSLRTMLRNMIHESLNEASSEKQMQAILSYMNSPTFKDFNDFKNNNNKSLSFNAKRNADSIKQIFDGYTGNTLARISVDTLPKEIKDLNNKSLNLMVWQQSTNDTIVLSNITANNISMGTFSFVVLNNINVSMPPANNVFRSLKELYARNITISKAPDIEYGSDKLTLENINSTNTNLYLQFNTSLTINSVKTKNLTISAGQKANIKSVTIKNLNVAGTLTIDSRALRMISGAPKLTGNEATDNAQLKKFFKVNNVVIKNMDHISSAQSSNSTIKNKDIKWELPEDMDDMYYEYEAEDEGYSFSAAVTGTDSAGNNYTGMYNGFLKSSDQDLDDRDFWSNIKFGPAQWKKVENIEKVQ